MDVSNSLGIRQMPTGYALMINNDMTHFYWLKTDGTESCISWDKWAVYRGAVKHSKTPN
jgi:predicted DNA-binding WGR domain protein